MILPFSVGCRVRFVRKQAKEESSKLPQVTETDYADSAKTHPTILSQGDDIGLCIDLLVDVMQLAGRFRCATGGCPATLVARPYRTAASGDSKSARRWRCTRAASL